MSSFVFSHDLDLYANVVHAKSFSSVDTRHRDIDIVVIRENTEGKISYTAVFSFNIAVASDVYLVFFGGLLKTPCDFSAN